MDHHILEAIEALTVQVNSEIPEGEVTEKLVVEVSSDEQVPAFLAGWLIAKGIAVPSDLDLSKEYVLKLLEG